LLCLITEQDHMVEQHIRLAQDYSLTIKVTKYSLV
jgi:hypothetical protein